jgi:hypothetical protein
MVAPPVARAEHKTGGDFVAIMQAHLRWGISELNWVGAVGGGWCFKPVAWAFT